LTAIISSRSIIRKHLRKEWSGAMPIMTLDIVAAKLFGDISSSLSDTLKLSLTAKLDDGERLGLATGEKIKDVDIYVGFYTVPTDEHIQHFKRFSGWADYAKGVGTLAYLASHENDGVPASLHFQFYPSEPQLTKLVMLAQHGRFPSRLNITVPDGQGMQYGWEPDGSGKDWDNISNQILPVESVHFLINLPTQATDNPSPPDSPFLPALNQILFWQKRTCFVMVIIGIILILRRWV
jgi:hypothetical protein